MRKSACGYADKLIENPKIVAGMLASLVERERESSVTTIYFAAPPTEMKFIIEVRKFLKKKNIHVLTALGLDIWVIMSHDSLWVIMSYPTKEMIEFMETKYADCDEVTGNKYDLLSLIEQEMCFNSFIFLRASGSSWSKLLLNSTYDSLSFISGRNVQYERVIANKTKFAAMNMEFFQNSLMLEHINIQEL